MGKCHAQHRFFKFPRVIDAVVEKVLYDLEDCSAGGGRLQKQTAIAGTPAASRCRQTAVTGATWPAFCMSPLNGSEPR